MNSIEGEGISRPPQSYRSASPLLTADLAVAFGVKVTGATTFRPHSE